MPTNLASNLRLARERLRLTQEQVHERTEIGPSTLSEFENGHRQPSLVQLQALAHLYQRSLGWLLDEEAGAGDLADEEVVLWRQRPDVELAADIEAQFRKLCEQYRNLELWCSESVEWTLPMVSKDGQRFGYSEAARLAKSVRDELALGDRPGENLLRVLEEVCGIKVFHFDFEPTGTAASSLGASFGAAILMNRGNVPWRRTFDLAHELFHLLTWRHFRGEWSGEPLAATPREESLANTFAGNLLLPEEPFRLAVQRRIREPTATRLVASIDRVYSVAREFAVSVDAVLVRIGQLFDLERASVAEARDAWRCVRPAYERRGLTDTPQLLPDRYRALAVSAFEQGEISTGKFAEYMGISRYQAMQLIAGRGGDGRKAAPAPAQCERRA